MGTTADALRTQTGAQIGFVLAIEGFEYLITDAAVLSKVTTAWTGTDWTQALGGLRFEGELKQSIAMWSSELDIPTLRFIIQPDELDTFATRVFATNPSVTTKQQQVFLSGTGGQTVTVSDTTGFASSGDVYVGRERMSYTSKTATTFVVPATTGRGKLAPFKANTASTNQFPQSHPLAGSVSAGSIADQKAFDTAQLPRVTQNPRVWMGKWVGLWVHRIKAGVWDTKAQAQLIFAGRITDIQDSFGGTVIDCEDMRAVVRDTVVHRNPFVGKVREGIKLIAGDTFYAGDFNSITGLASQSTVQALVVVTSGAAGANQINEGWHTADEICNVLTKWMASEYAAARMNGRCRFSLGAGQAGDIRFTMSSAFSSTSRWSSYFGCNQRRVLEHLGFPTDALVSPNDGPVDRNYWSARAEDEYVSEHQIVAPNPPIRVLPIHPRPFSDPMRNVRVEFSSYDQKIIDQQDFLPEPYRTEAVSQGGNWGIFQVGPRKKLCAAQYDGSYNFTKLYSSTKFRAMFGDEDERGMDGLTYDDEGDYEIVQVLMLAGGFADIVLRLFASVDGNGTNHATYDAFPTGVGAGIPWEILGSNFERSCKSVQQASNDQSIVVVVEKPTRLIELIQSEMILRFAFLIFKDQTLQFVSPPTPNSNTADHTLTESNKAGPSGDQDDLRMGTRYDRGLMRNNIKVQYDRSISDDKYRSIVSIKDETSIADHGLTQAITINARNGYQGYAGTGTGIESLIAGIGARMMPAFGRPLRVYQRSVNFNFFHAAPGDTVSLTDSFARDPTTGARGMSARAAIIMDMNYSFGQEGGEIFGEMTLLFADEDRCFPMSPTAEVDETAANAGYNAGTFTLTCKAHAHSRSTESVDVSNFAANDVVVIMQVDPASAASTTNWTRTISSVNTGANTITLTSALSMPAWDTALIYRIFSTTYTGTQTSQKTKAYLADATDDLIQNTIAPNTYGETALTTDWTTSVATAKPELIPTAMYGEGQPISPGQIKTLIQNLNWLCSYGTAVTHTMMHRHNSDIIMNNTSYFTVAVVPLHIQGATPSSRLRRRFTIAPLANGNAGTANVRVTLSRYAPKGTVLGAAAEFIEPYVQNEWTFTGSSNTVGSDWTVNPVRVGQGQFSYLTVELKSSNNAGIYFGLVKCVEGPLE